MTLRSITLACGLALALVACGSSHDHSTHAHAAPEQSAHDHRAHDHAEEVQAAATGLAIVELGVDGAKSSHDGHDHQHESPSLNMPALGAISQTSLSQWVSAAAIDTALAGVDATGDQRDEVARHLLAESVFAEAARRAGIGDRPASTNTGIDVNRQRARSYELHLRKKLAPSPDELQRFYDESFVAIANGNTIVAPFDEVKGTLHELLITESIDDHYPELLTEFGLLPAR